MKKGIFYLIIAAAISILAVLLVRARKPQESAGVAATKGVKTAAVKGELDVQGAFIDVADKVGKAVVTISTERIRRIGFGQAPLRFRRFGGPFGGGEDPIERFFEEFFGQLPQREFRQKGLGSGFIIDKKGYILTNYHVVERADEINVTLPDGRAFPATVKGVDPRSDIAVIKINARNLPTVELGNSDLVRVGEWVVALGNPFGHIIRSPMPTVTAGVISALHRRIPTPDGEMGYLDMIQTDAAINPGNSGGPLCDLSGKVIGINVAIFTTSGGYQGIGFAIPVNAVKANLKILMQGKEIEYGWLGVSAQEITPEIAAYFNLPDRKGVLIAQVIPDSPAEKAGLREGDIIRALDGKEIRNLHELLKEVGRKKVGATVAVDILRDRVKMRINVTVGRRPLRRELARQEAIRSAEEVRVWRGIRVADITDEIARRLGLESKAGVVIVEVDPMGAGYNAGLRKGEVIREINRTRINNTSDYSKVISEAKGPALVRTDRGYFVVKEEGGRG